MSVSPKALERGLLALGEAYRQKLDASTQTLWAKVLAPLNDAQFNYGVGVQLRSADRFLPPPGVVLAYGYDMPREAEDRPPPKYVLPEHTVQDQERLLQVVRDNPISDRENNAGLPGRMHYIRRIAITAGLMPDDAEPAKAMPGRTPGEEG